MQNRFWSDLNNNPTNVHTHFSSSCQFGIKLWTEKKICFQKWNVLWLKSFGWWWCSYFSRVALKYLLWPVVAIVMAREKILTSLWSPTKSFRNSYSKSALFRNRRFMLDEMTCWNVSKFFYVYESQSYFSPMHFRLL